MSLFYAWHLYPRIDRDAARSATVRGLAELG
jgi:hypothetical protein